MSNEIKTPELVSKSMEKAFIHLVGGMLQFEWVLADMVSKVEGLERETVELRKELEYQKALNAQTYSNTCVNHNDDERAAIRFNSCPVCLNNRLKTAVKAIDAYNASKPVDDLKNLRKEDDSMPSDPDPGLSSPEISGEKVRAHPPTINEILNNYRDELGDMAPKPSYTYWDVIIATAFRAGQETACSQKHVDTARLEELAYLYKIGYRVRYAYKMLPSVYVISNQVDEFARETLAEAIDAAMKGNPQ